MCRAAHRMEREGVAGRNGPLGWVVEDGSRVCSRPAVAREGSPSHQEPFVEIDFHVNMLLALNHVKFITAKKLAPVKQAKLINVLPNEIECQLVIVVVAELIELIQCFEKIAEIES